MLCIHQILLPGNVHEKLTWVARLTLNIWIMSFQIIQITLYLTVHTAYITQHS